MKKIISSKILYLVLRAIIGGLFVYAGATKITDVMGFASIIDQYGLVSWRMAKLVAHVLPIVEIVAGLGLIFDIKGSLGIIVAQLLGFVGILAYGIHLGLDVDCGCFGPADPGASSEDSLWTTLYRDLFMIGACLIIYVQRYVAGFKPRSILAIFRRNRE